MDKIESNTLQTLPLVTVICLCYNHEQYVKEALISVYQQTYPNIELIVVDDFSKDNSTTAIQQYIDNQLNKNIPTSFLPLKENVGNCKAFNQGLKLAKGKYIIDLAADDKLLPHCIEKQVFAFEQLEKSYAVVFSDLNYIDEKGNLLKTHFQRDAQGNLSQEVPQGNIYERILRQSFVSAASQLIRKTVLDELGGYDETLSYEDYDFWIRTAKKYKYFFINEILVEKRVLNNSHGRSFYLKKNNKHLLSTLQIHQKALAQNETFEENLALAASVRYHLRLSFYTENFDLVPLFADLLAHLDKKKWIDRLVIRLSTLKIHIFFFYSIYLRIKGL